MVTIEDNFIDSKNYTIITNIIILIFIMEDFIINFITSKNYMTIIILKEFNYNFK